MLSNEFDIINHGMYQILWDKITHSLTKEILFSFNDMISMIKTVNPYQMFDINTGMDIYKRYLRIFLMDFSLKYKMNLTFDPHTEEYQLYDTNHQITVRIQSI